jgi:predicted RNA binding protein YcfA (HicA-like mRNA interferase family)
MPPLRAVDYRTLARIFEHDGFTFHRQHGDHRIFTKAGILRPLVIPTSQSIVAFDYRNPGAVGTGPQELAKVSTGTAFGVEAVVTMRLLIAILALIDDFNPQAPKKPPA